MIKRGVIIKEKNHPLGPIANALRKTGVDILDFSDTKLIKNYDYLIIFYNKLPPYFETKAKIGWWMNDLKIPEKLIQHKTKFDYIFLCNEEYFYEYIDFFKKPIVYMPQCGLNSDNTFCRPIEWEVLFIGNNSLKKYHNNRKEILDKIGECYFLKIISGEKRTEDQNLLYKNTKFNLSISAPLQTVTSNRLYNILASGGFALVSWFPGIDKLFINHQHLVWFKTPEEAIKWMNYYENNPKKYERIKRLGHQLYLEKHTAQCRIQNMFDIMEGKETKFRGWLSGTN
jgi:hypothetical protein